MNENVIKQIDLNGVLYDIQSKELTKVTYAELKEMRDNDFLVAGHLYRITDYEFTTKQTGTKSAGHVFDIIVLATTENQLSHIARAIAHEGDTYFDGNDLGAWELWYDLDNDIEKYEWADAENGKGIIYRMIDEKGNDCPYDFKNALFYNEKLTGFTTPDKYYYMFSYIVSSKLYDGTVERQVKNCYGNSMAVYLKSNKRSLNLNVFRNTSFGYSCYSNSFGRDCHSNTFGYSCASNSFGNSCHSNTFGYSCASNSFGNSCYSNSFGNSCHHNTFGNSCDYNSFGNSCVSNSFGNSCYYNSLGNSCHSNSFGRDCDYNSFGNSCDYNSFGRDCDSNSLGEFCVSNSFGDNVSNRAVNSTKTSITLNEEYFDDGSGKLVPIKHPDLSTQPSILPYKFMGQYVYEQLIPASKYDTYLDVINLGTNNPILLSVVAIQKDGYTGNDARCMIEGNQIRFFMGNSPISDPIYYRIIYTSMPEEGDYYGYNSY